MHECFCDFPKEVSSEENNIFWLRKQAFKILKTLYSAFRCDELSEVYSS